MKCGQEQNSLYQVKTTSEGFVLVKVNSKFSYFYVKKFNEIFDKFFSDIVISKTQKLIVVTFRLKNHVRYLYKLVYFKLQK